VIRRVSSGQAKEDSFGSTKERSFWISEGKILLGRQSKVSSGIAKKGFFWGSKERVILRYLF